MNFTLLKRIFFTICIEEGGTQMYEINGFIIFNTEDSTIILQNELGIVQVDNRRMIEFLCFLDTKTSKFLVSNVDLNKWFGSELENALTFLLTNGILKKKNPLNFDIKKVVFYSNDKSMDHLFDEYLKREAPNEFIRIEGLKNLPIDEHTLLITFINPLSFEQMDLIYEEVKKHDSIWSLSYPYNNDIYFNNIYRWSWHVPCYKCVLAGLQNRERVDIFDEVSYQKIIEELYEQYPSFEPEIKLSFTDSIRIFSLLDFILDSLIYRRKSKEIDRTGNTNLLDVYQLNLRN